MFNKKKIITVGAEIPIDILYKNHHTIKHHFNDIIVTVENMDIEATTKMFKYFGTYNLFVKPPSYVNMFNAKASESFAKTDQFYRGLLNASGITLNGVILDLGEYGDLNPEYVDNIFQNIFLKKLILEYTRRGKIIILKNSSKTLVQSFTLNYILALVRKVSNKHLVVGLDVAKSHYVNARFLDKGTTVKDLGRLKKEFKYVFLSGIGKKGKKVPIFDCSLYSEHSYINLIKGLNTSTFMLEYNGNLRELIDTKNRIKMLAE